jgi:hypothetical protein
MSLPASKEGPLATKAQAAAWLVSYVGGSAGRVDEAFKNGAVEIAAKLAAAGGDGSSGGAVASNALSLLAAMSRGPPQYREAVLGARPAVLSTVQAAFARGRSSSTAAAAAGERCVEGCVRAWIVCTTVAFTDTCWESLLEQRCCASWRPRPTCARASTAACWAGTCARCWPPWTSTGTCR